MVVVAKAKGEMPPRKRARSAELLKRKPAAAVAKAKGGMPPQGKRARIAKPLKQKPAAVEPVAVPNLEVQQGFATALSHGLPALIGVAGDAAEPLVEEVGSTSDPETPETLAATASCESVEAPVGSLAVGGDGSLEVPKVAESPPSSENFEPAAAAVPDPAGGSLVATGPCCECGQGATLGVDAHRPDKSRPRLRHDECRNRKMLIMRHLREVSGSWAIPMPTQEVRAVLGEAKAAGLSNAEVLALTDKKYDSIQSEKAADQVLKETLPETVWNKRGFSTAYLDAHCISVAVDTATGERLYKMAAEREFAEKGTEKRTVQSVSGASTDSAKTLRARAKKAIQASSTKVMAGSVDKEALAKAKAAQKANKDRALAVY